MPAARAPAVGPSRVRASSIDRSRVRFPSIDRSRVRPPSIWSRFTPLDGWEANPTCTDGEHPNPEPRRRSKPRAIDPAGSRKTDPTALSAPTTRIHGPVGTRARAPDPQPHRHAPGPASCYSVMFGSASISSDANSPCRNFSRATTAIMAALSVHAFCGGTVTRIP